MAALFHNIPIAHDKDNVRIFYGGKAMSDNKGSSSPHQVIHSLLNQDFRPGIHLVSTSTARAMVSSCFCPWDTLLVSSLSTIW